MEYRKKQNRFVYAFKQTDLLREKRKIDKQERESAENCAAWVELGKNSVSNRYRKIWAVSHGIVRVYTVSEMG